MGKKRITWLILGILALATLAARVNLAPVPQVAGAAVVMQEDTPVPDTGNPDGLPSSAGESQDEVGEHQARQLDQGVSNWPLLVLVALAFLVVIIGLVARSRPHNTP